MNFEFRPIMAPTSKMRLVVNPNLTKEIQQPLDVRLPGRGIVIHRQQTVQVPDLAIYQTPNGLFICHPITANRIQTEMIEKLNQAASQEATEALRKGHA